MKRKIGLKVNGRLKMSTKVELPVMENKTVAVAILEPTLPEQEDVAVTIVESPVPEDESAGTIIEIDESPSHDEIAVLAYSYWDARGRQGGSAEEDWFQAERELRGQKDAEKA